MHSVRKILLATTLFAACSFTSFHSYAQPKGTVTAAHLAETKKLFIGVHQFEPGTVATCS